jgi:hypothetical protein
LTTPQEVPPVDTGNQLLAVTPAMLVTALLQTADGQRLGLTIRTPSTTLTVLLTKADAELWAKNLKGAADGISGSGLIAAGNGHIPPPPQGAAGAH